MGGWLCADSQFITHDNVKTINKGWFLGGHSREGCGKLQVHPKQKYRPTAGSRRRAYGKHMRAAAEHKRHDKKREKTHA